VTIGRPRRHLRETTSTNELARALAVAGAPHGTLVTTGFQSAGRGRQGRTWTAPPGRALLLSLVVREPDPLLPLRAGLARPQEGWAVVGIGVNAAFAHDELPPELNAGTLGRSPAELEATLGELLGHLDARLAQPAAESLAALRARDALLDRAVSWPGGQGVGAGIDEDGRLRVRGPGGEQVLDAGEVHLGSMSTAAG
jgi:BirA family biotin operon repressor/biotin-[acetyl-CoA-carboxylase] ligase